MAKTYRITPFVRISNAIVARVLRLGVNIGGTTLLTVTGRSSGQPRTTPITILNWKGNRLIQSPFGDVNWVRNLRAAGGATLSRGRRKEAIAVVELSPAEAAPVYKEHLASFPAIIRNYFDVTPDSPIDEFEREMPRHPMFLVVPQESSGNR